MQRLCPWLALLFVFIAGCQSHPGYRPEAIDITGTLKLRGKPLSGVVLNLQPTQGGHPATASVTDGNFKARVTPGKYCYFLSEGETPAGLQEVPKEYLSANIELRDELTVEPTTTTLDIEMD